jgi:hypothetical protein
MRFIVLTSQKVARPIIFGSGLKDGRQGESRDRFCRRGIGYVPGSTLPDELRKAGYDVTEVGEGERILPTAIVEKFVARADGEFEPLTEGSTRPIASTVTHAGICKVKRYALCMP